MDAKTVREMNDPHKDSIIRALDAERGNQMLIEELKNRVDDFNAVIESILSASKASKRSGGSGYAIVDNDVIEILRQHRILNNRALARIGEVD
jgi:hypothetical protein